MISLSGRGRKDRKTQCPLTFVIVGGSIAGLACAFALGRAGHRVIVLEKGDAESHSSCTRAIRSPPNMSRILQGWGLHEKLRQVMVRADCTVLRIGQTGEKIGLFRFHEQIMQALGAEVLFFPYGQLWQELYKAAVDVGASIRFNSTVTGVTSSRASKPCVVLSDGTEVSGDLVIGADGNSGMSRRCVLGGTDESGIVDRRSIFSLEVPMKELEDRKELRALTEASNWDIWLGDGGCIHGHPSVGTYLYSHGYQMNFMLPDASQDVSGEDWECQYPVQGIVRHLEGYTPSLRDLVSCATGAVSVRYIRRDRLSSFSDDNDTLILVGDAAHNLPPNSTQNVALALEDATTLGNLLWRLRSQTQLSMFLGIFDELRLPRSAEVFRSEHEKHEFLSLPYGPLQKMRDEGLRIAMQKELLDWDEADEEYLRSNWEEYIRMFDYDASEAVDDWWSKWGSLMDAHSSNGD
ncbi:FAD/NAD P-binding domain-containing protein [Gloeophyllum trabeum ATCC 11539]|uniref:FAD/NAD P-binding domain-containing protein n=1 Tax=Gloeophyllum trabeum (strain ATCC 11539 / FP-39264 / Madison 617) TaxID=670483 RepID=S7Q2U3_GLOTA|nr:FAD/NAD P-binding domain-containing protein [Gloeophyllum trabeum ATCC 11539]EPQ54316.1 FAD/NAD P-binding domain-containing protein [Gloeophyllum trabeum ATCC 11539]